MPGPLIEHRRQAASQVPQVVRVRAQRSQDACHLDPREGGVGGERTDQDVHIVQLAKAGIERSQPMPLSRN